MDDQMFGMKVVLAPLQKSSTFHDQCTPLLWRKSKIFLMIYLRFEFSMCFNVLSKAKKVCFIFSPTWSPLCGSFLSYVTKQKRKKWRKLIKGSIFWSKISKKDYLQQGDISFMFKNRHNKFLFYQFWQENKKIDCNQPGYYCTHWKVFSWIIFGFLVCVI